MGGSAVRLYRYGGDIEPLWEKAVYGALPFAAGIGLFVLGWRRIASVRPLTYILYGSIVIATIIGDCFVYAAYRRHRWERWNLELSWTPETRIFNWQRGSVAFPHGFSYRQERGIDTFMGRFVSPDGKLEVRHDIGELAGEHGGIGAYTESLSSGSRVKIAHGTTAEGKAHAAVSFPDSGCANFFMEADRAEDTRIIDAIAQSFRPAGWTSRLLPILPEILRSDCRYRLNLPDWF